jgi:RNA polymerase sigma factor (sigma-70 family)
MESDGFERFCEVNYGRVVRTAFLILGDRQEALDVAQETFVRAFERWRQVAEMENPEGWLIKVAANQALSRRRVNRRRSAAPAIDEEMAPPEPQDPTLVVVLRRLTPRQRAALALRFYLDQSVEQTAELLNVKPGTVRALTAQGVARLREQLGPNWLEEGDEQRTP